MRRLTGSTLAIGLGIAAIGLSIDLIGLTAAPSVLAESERPGAAQSANVLINPGFEDGFYLPVPSQDSVRVPNGWHIRWYTDSAPVPPDGNPQNYLFRQPETSLINIADWPYCCAINFPPRIHSGRYALASGKQWSPQDVSFYQTVGNVPIGAVVTASAWLHAWTSSCNPTPQNAPAEPALSLLGPNTDDEFNCRPGFWPIDTNHMLVGIDPTGGIEPRAASVVWNWHEADPAWWGPYDYYSSTVPAVAVAQAHTVTMFLRAVTIQPVRYHDVYFDDASLTYSFPVSAGAEVDGQWPLPVVVTLSVQSPVSLTHVTVSVDSGEPIEWVDTTPVKAASLARWHFAPVWPGLHTVTLTAAELATPLVQTVNVPVLYSEIQQHRLLPHGESTLIEPVWITLTLRSPITLSAPTVTLTDSLGAPLSITLKDSEFLNPGVNYRWSFATALAGLHTINISATEFTQPFSRSILVAAARVYLPVAVRNFSAP
jgi:hypothetical protein